MPILNYTTSIEAIKTAGEIQGILAMKGAHSIAIDYDQGQPEALMFRLKARGHDIAFRLPCNWRGVLEAMRRDKKCPLRLMNDQQARRVAWRIVKDWVEAQLAIIESGQAEVTEAFFQYALTDDGRTLFQRMIDEPALLGSGSTIQNPARLLGAGDSPAGEGNLITGTFGDRG